MDIVRPARREDLDGLLQVLGLADGLGRMNSHHIPSLAKKTQGIKTPWKYVRK